MTQRQRPTTTARPARRRWLRRPRRRSAALPAAAPDAAAAPAPRRRRGRRWRALAIAAAALVAALTALRLALPALVERHVGRVLDQSPLYDGEIGGVDIHLWRGAYSIHDVRILKTTGNVPVPFFAAQRLDIALEWRSLLAGEFVGRIEMLRPELNFVDADDDSQDQSGEGGPWLEMLDDLSPFDINTTEIRDGRVHFRAFQSDPQVDVYLSSVEATVANLTNVHEDVTPMFSTVRATALAMDQARFELDMRLDPFSYRPTFHAAARLLGLDVTKTNALAQAYAGVDFESGWFDLVVELDAREGALTGYVKPFFRDVDVFDLREDAADRFPVSVVWQALVGGAANLFQNQPREQVATLVPLRGDVADPSADVLATLVNVLRNAFVRAYLPRLEREPEDPTFTLGPAEPAEPEPAAPPRR